jgi:hypothetical protein
VTTLASRSPSQLQLAVQLGGDCEAVCAGKRPGQRGAACGNRTHDLRITSALLWPTELRRRGHRAGAR